MLNRRSFLGMASTGVAATIAQSVLPRPLIAQAHKGMTMQSAPKKVADHVLRIEETSLEIAPGINIKTVAYNGQVPGPLLRMKHGVPVSVDVINNSKVPDLLHWHGFDIDPINDGAMEEGSPMINPGQTVRYAFTPNLTGSRWYHTHASAEHNLNVATYTGQYGFAYVEPAIHPGDYDQEVFLAVHHWEPEMVVRKAPEAGCDVTYKYATFNGKTFAASEPIKVKKGQRVLFHFLNASATRNVTLSLPGHRFRILALDGNPVPTPTLVENLWLGVAERIDAVVEMDQPGVWMLSSSRQQDRDAGLGISIEYAGSTGKAVWQDPSDENWDYLLFGKPGDDSVKPDEIHNMIFGAKLGAGPNGMDLWMINGKSWPDIEPLEIKQGKRIRLSFLNASREKHPVHLHRHTFEVMSINGKKTSGIMKDTLTLPAFGNAQVDFIANNPGPTLFHCHQQHHMDFGFMQLIKYTS